MSHKPHTAYRWAAARLATPSLIILSAAALAACGTTSQYAPRPGMAAPAPREPLRPNFPITQAAPGDPLADAAQAAAPPAPSDVGAPVARPSGSISAQPLPPPVSSQALPPIQPSPVAPASPAPTAYAPPSTRTVTTTVTSVSGRVVDVTGKREIYTVKSGDNLTVIARRMDISQKELAAENDLEEPYALRPGQKLRGPQTKAKAYVVGQGDTLSAISRRFGVTPAALAAANDMKTSDSIRSGQRLELPPGYKDSGPVRRTVTTTVPVEPAVATTVAAAPVYAPPPPPPPPPAAAAITTVVTSTPPTRTAPGATTTQTITTAPAAPPPRTPAAPVATTMAAVPPAARPVTTTTTTTTAPPRLGAAPVTTTTTVIRPAPASTPTSAAPALPVDAAAMSDAEIAAAGRGRFAWPVQGSVLSGFGPKGTGQRNDGLNLRASAGEPVKSAAAGEVVYAGDQVPGFGNLVLVKHDGGWVTAYAHLARADVRMRQTVAQGQQIGQVGSTGGVAEPQLHFEVRYAPSAKDKARPIDPALVLPR